MTGAYRILRLKFGGRVPRVLTKGKSQFLKIPHFRLHSHSHITITIKLTLKNREWQLECATGWGNKSSGMPGIKLNGDPGPLRGDQRMS